MIELRNLRKSLSEATILDGIDLEVPAGTTTALIGPSGSGKSTLLKILIGLLIPDQGSVLIQDEAMSADNLLRLRRRMGYVIQGGGLFPHLTARDNVTLVAEYLGYSGSQIDSQVRELAALTKINEDMLQRYPAQLSGGQQQRVSLMRALMLEPELLLLDEPLGALDPIRRAELQTDLQAIFQTFGKTVVLVTHDLPEAAFFADRMVLLQHGRIAQSGRLEDMIAQPASRFVTEFIEAQRTSMAGMRYIG